MLNKPSQHLGSRYPSNSSQGFFDHFKFQSAALDILPTALRIGGSLLAFFLSEKNIAVALTKASRSPSKVEMASSKNLLTPPGYA